VRVRKSDSHNDRLWNGADYGNVTLVSELRVQPRADNRDRATVAIVRRVDNELIVERRAPDVQGELSAFSR